MNPVSFKSAIIKIAPEQHHAEEHRTGECGGMALETLYVSSDQIAQCYKGSGHNGIVLSNGENIPFRAPIKDLPEFVAKAQAAKNGTIMDLPA